MPNDLAVKPSLTLKRRIKATPEKVYAAWTEPAQLMKWFGPMGAEMNRFDLDLRVGGRFHAQFTMPDGEEHNVGGSYLEVTPNEKLVFTWAWFSTPERESLVTLTFKRDGDGTLVTLLHERFYDEAARDSHRGGWTSILENLETYFG